ncbi:histidine protein methyltransferase 1 homolog [Babylonia areolata]|uniref:histidine protein methyltransferase 1 homolog n=1 Tax=Babylonia areolata TaxID=304850 RepID=UPI003FD0BE9B
MSDFKFNFVASDDEAGTSNDDTNEENVQESCTDSGPEAREVPWTSVQPLQNLTTVQHKFGSHTLLTVTTAAVEDFLLQQKSDDSGVVQAISGHTDLIAGQYEGGLKVWECGVDLCQYLAESGVPVEGSRVLELGCGAGLPGILASRMGALSVHFQDFNEEVLEMYTMKNVELNNVKPASCTFFSGDWASFASLAKDQHYRYDFILTAETIYNVSSYSKLLTVFSSLLTKEGIVLVAAKNDYFGVGGSVSSFVHFLHKADPQFAVETVKLIDTDLPRKILKLTRT